MGSSVWLHDYCRVLFIYWALSLIFFYTTVGGKWRLKNFVENKKYKKFIHLHINRVAVISTLKSRNELNWLFIVRCCLVYVARAITISLVRYIFFHYAQHSPFWADLHFHQTHTAWSIKHKEHSCVLCLWK